MKKFQLVLVSLICVGGIAQADDHRDDHEEHELREEHEEFHRETEILGRNVLLEFKAIPLEEGDTGIFIISASSEFENHIRLEGDDGEILFGVSGRIQLLDEDHIFVYYEAHTELTGDDGEAEFHTESGVLLQSGRPLLAAKLGDKTLVITATFVDEGGTPE